MNDPSGKVTIKQLRTLFPFDPATLARQADIAVETIFHTLDGTPIARQDAGRLLAALTVHTGLTLSFEQVQIITWEDFLLLWVIRASAQEAATANVETQDRYHLVYARDWQHASMLAQSWFTQYPQHPAHFFTACPQGLKIDDIVVPGHWQVSMES
jgi:hypothetical protein